MYSLIKIRVMKKRDLEKKLSIWGWYFLRHGGSHDTWTNGQIQNFIPRHSEISENLAKGIIKKAEKFPGGIYGV
jgi:mRNA interferase HicA